MTAPQLEEPAAIPAQIIRRGDGWARSLRFNATDGSPLDLTTYGTVFASEARRSEDGPLLLTLTVDSTHAVTGLLVLTAHPAETALLDLGTLGYDVRISAADASAVSTIATGELTVVLGYTHA